MDWIVQIKEAMARPSTQAQTSPSANAFPRWLSENPNKAWGEKFFLIYSPIWMAFMALIMASGVVDRVGELGFIAIGLVVAVPLFAMPALIRSEANDGRPWYDTYWFKANLFIAIFNFAGNYFGSEYFFDVLGMVYDYPMIELNLDATLVGSGEQKVPVVMYLLTQAYWMTYHTTAIIVLRRIRSAGLATFLWPVVVAVIAYFWAWMETKTMANPWIAHQFHYKDLDRMLTYGSLFYGLYFLASFPIFYWLDEKRGESWSLWKTTGAALAASMIMLFLLDFAAAVIGTL